MLWVVLCRSCPAAAYLFAGGEVSCHVNVPVQIPGQLELLVIRLHPLILCGVYDLLDPKLCLDYRV